MTAIADEGGRQRFARELDRNFSVIASAGSGKTRAITDRILNIASRPQGALESLPQLVVVTYTNRAADEMQQRTRQRILEAGWPGLGEPTHGTIVGDTFYFLANSGWGEYDNDGKKKPGSGPVESSIRKIDLNTAPF